MGAFADEINAGSEKQFSFEKTKPTTSKTTTTAGGTFARSAAESAVQTPGVIAAGALAAEASLPFAPMAGPFAPAVPVVAGAIGGIAAGVAQSKVIDKAEGAIDNLFGTNIQGIKKQQSKEHPDAELLGGVAGGMVGPGMAPGFAKSYVNAAGRTVSGLEQAGVGAGAMTAIGATQRAIEGGDAFDPKSLAADFVSGGFTRQTELGRKIHNSVVSVASPKTPSDHIVATAFMKKEDGTVEFSGPKHNETKKDYSKDTHIQGFVTKSGQFLDRKQAEAHARQTGQIKPDYKLERPEEGLHSGDMRANGQDSFTLKPQTPLASTNRDGVTTLNHEAIRDDFNNNFAYIYDSTTATGQQKRAVFDKLGIDRETMKLLIPDHETYAKFIQAHEDNHVANGDHASYPRDAGGRPDLMSPDALAIETRATQHAFQAVKDKALMPHPDALDPEIVQHKFEAGKQTGDPIGANDAFNQHGVVPKNPEQLADSFYALTKQGEADMSSLFGRQLSKAGRWLVGAESDGKYQKAVRAGYTPEMGAKFYDHLERGVPLNGEEQSIFDSFGKDSLDAIHAQTKRQVELGRVSHLELDPEKSGKHVPRISVPTKMTAKSFLEKLTGSKQGGFDADITKAPGAMSERGYFVAERADGKRIVIQPRGKDLFAFNNKKQSKFGANSSANEDGSFREVRAGDKYGENWTIKEAFTHEIEQHTNQKYLKDFLAVAYKREIEARSFDRANNHFENFIKSDYFKEIAKPASDKDVPPNWKTLKVTDKVPQLAPYRFEPRVGAILEDFAKVWKPNTLNHMTNFLIKNMMLNPLPHMNNEAWHWYNARGLSGWVTPAGAARFARTMPGALKSVITQDKFYRDIMNAGGSILGADVRNSATFSEIMQKGIKEAQSDPTVTNHIKELGMKPVEFYDAISKKMSIAMWTVRDAMYVQLIKEQQIRGHDLHGAIKEVERHMPSYRIPETVMGSRTLSEVLQNPNLTVFSRYHYGMMKSLINTAKDMAGKGPQGKEGMKQGWDSAAAIAVAMAVIYPLMDQGAQWLTGNKNAEFRKAGPYHLFDAIKGVVTGDKEPLSLLQPLFTVNPVLLAGIQLPFNREFYTGKQIYHPADKGTMIARDLGMYAAKQIPQVSTGLRTNAAGGLPQWAAGQADIKAPTDKQVRNKERWKLKNARAAIKRAMKEGF